MKKLTSIVLLVCFLMTSSVAVIAKTTEVENFDIPQNEILYRVNKDGSFVTVEKNLISTTAACTHKNLEAISAGTIKTRKIYTAQYCYAARRVQDARCINCGKTGFKIYGPDEMYPHLFNANGTCTRCAYSKKG